MEETSITEQQSSAIKLGHIVYLLQALGAFIGITIIIAVIINYIKRSDIEGTFVESHFKWQIRTFWYGLLWIVVGFILSFIGIGLFILALNSVWILYRVIRGWLTLNDNKAMYVKS